MLRKLEMQEPAVESKTAIVAEFARLGREVNLFQEMVSGLKGDMESKINLKKWLIIKLNQDLNVREEEIKLIQDSKISARKALQSYREEKIRSRHDAGIKMIEAALFPYIASIEQHIKELKERWLIQGSTRQAKLDALDYLLNLCKSGSVDKLKSFISAMKEMQTSYSQDGFNFNPSLVMYAQGKKGSDTSILMHNIEVAIRNVELDIRVESEKSLERQMREESSTLQEEDFASTLDELVLKINTANLRLAEIKCDKNMIDLELVAMCMEILAEPIQFFFIPAAPGLFKRDRFFEITNIELPEYNKPQSLREFLQADRFAQYEKMFNWIAKMINWLGAYNHIDSILQDQLLAITQQQFGYVERLKDRVAGFIESNQKNDEFSLLQEWSSFDTRMVGVLNLFRRNHKMAEFVNRISHEKDLVGFEFQSRQGMKK